MHECIKILEELPDAEEEITLKWGFNNPNHISKQQHLGSGPPRSTLWTGQPNPEPILNLDPVWGNCGVFNPPGLGYLFTGAEVGWLGVGAGPLEPALWSGLVLLGRWALCWGMCPLRMRGSWSCTRSTLGSQFPAGPWSTAAGFLAVFLISHADLGLYLGPPLLSGLERGFLVMSCQKLVNNTEAVLRNNSFTTK